MLAEPSAGGDPTGTHSVPGAAQAPTDGYPSGPRFQSMRAGMSPAPWDSRIGRKARDQGAGSEIEHEVHVLRLEGEQVRVGWVREPGALGQVEPQGALGRRR